MPPLGAPGRRVAIVAGLRTPFARSGTTLKSLSAIELGKRCVAELIQHTELDGTLVEAIVYGTVVPSVLAPNIAREVSLIPLLPKGVQSFTVGRACASANQAITDAADQIVLGHADLVPITPAIAEPSTGETMGESAEKMAKINGISREAQDQFALRSHRLAAAGTEDGRLTAEIAPVYVPPSFEAMTSDNGIRVDSSLEALAALKPVFDRRYGSVTAGNSSPLTDGASAVLLMSEERAKTLGYAPLAFIRSYSYAALDPGEQLLMGPVLAAPVALARAGLALGDMDLIEMHEAFAAQVLCNLAGFVSKVWARRAGFNEPVGEVDRAKLNVMGGSVAIGHPFGATGGRILTTLCNELARRGGQFGLMTVCAAGGMGHAMVVERA